MSSALHIVIPDEPAPTPTLSFAPGAMLAGKYRVERELGAGGVGVVTLATHVELGQRVAIKYLRRSGRSAPSIERLKREAKLAASLRSEHAVKVYDVGARPDGTPFIVMEYLEGEDLASVLQRGPIAIDQAVQWTLEACHALEEAHALGIVHRDLKPANLFLARRPNGPPIVKILDFGISKIRESSWPSPVPAIHFASMTQQHETLGTPYYMSPEQLVSSANVDARTDLWALGVCLYELLTGHLPFDGHDDLMALAADILAAKPTPVRDHRPEIPTELAAIIHRCLTSDMAQRPTSVAAFVEAIRPFARPTPQASAPAPSASAPPLPVAKVPLFALLGGVGLLAVTALAASLVLARPSSLPVAQGLVGVEPPRQAVVALPLTSLVDMPSAQPVVLEPLAAPSSRPVAVHRPAPVVTPKHVPSPLPANPTNPIDQFGDRQ